MIFKIKFLYITIPNFQYIDLYQKLYIDLYKVILQISTKKLKNKKNTEVFVMVWYPVILARNEKELNVLIKFIEIAIKPAVN